jgi:ADP-heptose:LPS heptosyltransferase
LIAREKIRRILAVKLDHIGDFITAFPAFRRIKERFPDAELTVLAARASLSLAAMEPAIDRVIEFNFYHARSEKGRLAQAKRDLANLRATLAPRRFDLAIDLRRQPDTRPILQATGARWLAGFETAYEHPWLDIATRSIASRRAVCSTAFSHRKRVPPRGWRPRVRREGPRAAAPMRWSACIPAPVRSTSNGPPPRSPP